MDFCLKQKGPECLFVVYFAVFHFLFGLLLAFFYAVDYVFVPVKSCTPVMKLLLLTASTVNQFVADLMKHSSFLL